MAGLATLILTACSSKGTESTGAGGAGAGGASTTAGTTSASTTSAGTTSASTASGNDPSEAARDACVAKINALRATKGLPASAR